MADLNNGAMTGADRINNAPAIGSSKFATRSAGLTQAMHTRPMAGHGEAAAEILRSAGLGRRTPDKKSPGEQMSDADGPNQAVVADGNQMVHRKVENGGVSEYPVAHFPELDPYDYLDQPNSAKLATLQNNAGYPLQ